MELSGKLVLRLNMVKLCLGLQIQLGLQIHGKLCLHLQGKLGLLPLGKLGLRFTGELCFHSMVNFKISKVYCGHDCGVNLVKLLPGKLGLILPGKRVGLAGKRVS